MNDYPEKGAKIQRNGKYAIIPYIPGGMVNSSDLRKIADVADEYRLSLKITSEQRIAIFGINEADIDIIWEELGMKIGGLNGKCVKSAKFCPGNIDCNKGLQDSVKIGMTINENLLGVETPSKVKIAVSGCPNSCSESAVRDIGLIGTKKGWKILVGGNCGKKPKIGDLLVKDLSDDEAVEYVNRIIFYYQKNDTKKRLGRFIEDIGWYKFIEGLIS